MKLYLKDNVFEAALKRVAWLFDEFPNVIVDFSGGKDSTVVLNLALRVAEEKGRLPLDVTFLDQEAEWQSVIDYMRLVMNDPRIRPQWFQFPFLLSNATSGDTPFLDCWAPGKKWMREREPIAITENPTTSVRFHEIFNLLPMAYYPDQPGVRLCGMRCSESPARAKGLTSYETYKGATWGRKQDPKRGHYVMHPIYDWEDTDVWKAIHSNGWRYCGIYDAMFQHGVPIRQMRVSNLHHETAVHQLYYLQEVEGDTWSRLTERLNGINSAGQLQRDMFVPEELPFMFRDWADYRDYLCENLIVDPKIRAIFQAQFPKQEASFDPIHTKVIQKLHRTQVAAILVNDHEQTKFGTFRSAFNWAGKGGGTKGALKLGRAQKSWGDHDGQRKPAA